MALVLHVLPFAVRPALIGGDEPHYALMAHSLANGGDVDLTDAYQAVAEGSKAAGRAFSGRVLERHVREWRDRVVFSHPLGLPALGAPLLWLKDRAWSSAPPDLILGAMSLATTFAALVAGVYLMVRIGAGRPGIAAVLALYFSTPLWYYSRTFFTAPYLWALPVLSLWALARERWALAAGVLGVVVLVKESAVLTVAVILLGVLVVRGWRRATAIAAGPAVAGLVFLAKNVLVYGEPVVTSQAFRLGRPLEGLVGVLFDPIHGLAPFAPLAMVTLVTWPWAVSRSKARVSSHVGAAVIAAAWLALTASWVDWRGGSCYGPRLLVPLLPALVVPLRDAWSRATEVRWLAAVLATAFGVGFAVQWCAAVDPFTAFWSISITDLLGSRPWATASGLAIGLAGGWFLVRWAAMEPRAT
ncbi:MAG: hypothetical protein ACOY3Y_20985 [Acidobacteriota bacterium]